MVLYSLILAFFFSMCLQKIAPLQHNNYGQNLFNNITQKFSRFVPPLSLKDNLVKIYSELFQILEVDEKGGTITLKLVNVYIYQSEEAKWNPDEHHGVNVFDVPLGTFWKPNISKPCVSKIACFYNFTTIFFRRHDFWQISVRSPNKLRNTNK